MGPSSSTSGLPGVGTDWIWGCSVQSSLQNHALLDTQGLLRIFWTGKVTFWPHRLGGLGELGLRSNSLRREAFVFPSRSTRQSAHTPQERQSSTNASYAKKAHLPGTVCRPDGIFTYSWAMWSPAKTLQRNHTERVGAELNLDDNGLWNNQDCGVCHHLPSSEANRAPCWGIHQDQKHHQQRTHWLFPQEACIQSLYALWTIQALLLKTFFPLGILPSLFPRMHTIPLALALNVFITQLLKILSIEKPIVFGQLKIKQPTACPDMLSVHGFFFGVTGNPE